MNSEVKYITEFPDTGNKYDEKTWYNDHDNSLVIINCCATNIYYTEHWTPLSIKCAFNGKEYYKFKNTTYAVDDNNFLLLNEGNTYSSYINTESITESFTINFTKKNIEDLSAFVFYNENSLLDDPFKILPNEIRIYEKLYAQTYTTKAYINIIKNYQYHDGKDARQLLETLHLFLGELVTFNGIIDGEIDNVQAKKRITREEIYTRLHRVKDYIHSCYNEDISLDTLSKISYLNTFHLLREFKKYFHITPHKYLTQIRLKQALKLISQTDTKLVDIITEVGFEDLSSFSKLFKSYFGKSPQQFRAVKTNYKPLLLQSKIIQTIFPSALYN